MTLLLVGTTVTSVFLVRHTIHSKAGNTHYRGHVILSGYHVRAQETKDSCSTCMYTAY